MASEVCLPLTHAWCRRAPLVNITFWFLVQLFPFVPRLIRLILTRTAFAAWEVYYAISCSPSRRFNWHLCSKTFLARLCEQAERYDGEIPSPQSFHMSVCWLFDTRNGHIHEGQYCRCAVKRVTCWWKRFGCLSRRLLMWVSLIFIYTHLFMGRCVLTCH